MKKRKFLVFAISAALMIASGCGTWIKDRKCDHTWDSGVVTKEATCSAEGEKKYTCKNCGEKKLEAVAKNNVHTPDIIERVEPTCSKEGRDYGVFCTACQTILISPKKLPALRHDYGADGVCKNGGNNCPVLDENELPPVWISDDPFCDDMYDIIF